MKTIILALAILFISTNAQASPIKAAALYNICNQRQMVDVCVFYVLGVQDGMNYHTKMTNVSSVFCEMKSNIVVIMDVPKVITDYAKANSKILLEPGEVLVYEALKEFTCRDWSKGKPAATITQEAPTDNLVDKF